MNGSTITGVRLAPVCALLAAAMLAACSQPEMENQPKYETYEAAPGWANNQSARTPPAGTVARDDDLQPRPDAMPVPVDRALLERGRDRYNTFCLPCHGATGNADGMVVQRGFPEPPTFHSQRLRDAPPSHFYDVITDGYGVMYSYRDRVPAADRWAIAAYIRALQQARHTSVATLSAEQRRKLDAAQARP